MGRTEILLSSDTTSPPHRAGNRARRRGTAELLHEWTTPKKSNGYSEFSKKDKGNTGLFSFTSGLPDCCSSNPEFYSVLAELPNARLVQMKMAPGAEDKPHDHPPHSMYFVTSANLSITDYVDGKAGESHAVEFPAGAVPIFPGTARSVKNIGGSEAIAIFVEEFSACKPCGEVEGFISPFSAS